MAQSKICEKSLYFYFYFIKLCVKVLRLEHCKVCISPDYSWFNCSISSVKQVFLYRLVLHLGGQQLPVRSKKLMDSLLEGKNRSRRTEEQKCSCQEWGVGRLSWDLPVSLLMRLTGRKTFVYCGKKATRETFMHVNCWYVTVYKTTRI